MMRHIVVPWLARGWCRNFVVNLKFGRVDAVALSGIERWVGGVERPLLSLDDIAANTAAIRSQLERFVDTSGRNAAVVLNNAEWLAPLKAIEFMRDVGKHFTVNYMLQKESVKTRLEVGMSYTEFSYMLLQAYDYLQLYRKEGVTLQIGGSDQWGNITAGIELIRRSTGAEAHAPACSL